MVEISGKSLKVELGLEFICPEALQRLARMLGDRAWLSRCFSSSQRWSMGLRSGSVQASQVLPQKTGESFFFGIHLRIQGHCQCEKMQTQTIDTKLEEHYYLK